MTCRELITFLIEYTDGALEPHRRAVFERHLNACPSCRHYLDSYLQTVRLERDALGEPGDAPVPPSVPEGLVRAILASRRP